MSKLLAVAVLPAVALFFVPPLHGEESGDPAATPAGHSYHGEAFNEGPRQKAYLMGGTGKVDFPVSTEKEEAQAFINQGVGQLHGFWYLEAERSFRQAAAIDPDCAMAYWGMAMANYKNEKRGKGFLEEAMERKEKVTPREEEYLEALQAYFKAGSKKAKERGEALAKAYEDISLDHPEDLEAKAFHCLQLYLNKGKSPLQSYMAVNALLEEILAVEPMHPCHHFRIHLWDHKKPSRALTSAAKCGQAAPSIAHMWHMPGHIYSRLKRYHDAVWQQEASARVDHAHMMRDRVMPDEIHNFAHNNEWLIRNLIYLGRANDAVSLARNMTELPRHPKYNTFSKYGSAKYGRLRLFQALDSFEMWDELARLCNTPYLAPTDVESEQTKRLRHLARAYYHLGQTGDAGATVEKLQSRLDEKIKARDEAQAKAEEKARAKHEGEPKDDKEKEKREKEIEKARSSAGKPMQADIRALEQAIAEANGLAALAKGEHKTALEQLKKAGSVSKWLLAHVTHLSGDAEAAEKIVRDEASRNKNETLPLAHLVDILWKVGKQEDAKEQFEELRKIAGSADLSTAPLARLAPIAAKLELPPDWRIPHPPSSDAGDRPNLDELGPFRWSPSQANPFKLPGPDGAELSLHHYKGRPVLVIFYLGYGCLHCAEQLHAFAPRAQDFKEEAGVEMVAISSDDREGLNISIENYEGKAFPFPLLSNASLDTFKSYRCYDDFEKQPLHGAFLINGDGQILWQDISYEPFMKVDFLLKESKRLLAQETSPVKIASGAEE